MYVHLGNNVVISSKEIIAILNIEKPLPVDTRDIIEIARMERTLVNVSETGKEKALIICDDKVYLSPISSNTLLKRSFADYKEV
jgi:regulator of extracellular matrix RemA (YlzA/DUF370 family)